MNRKTILELGVFGLLGAIAIAGWVRKPEMTNAASAPMGSNQFATPQAAGYPSQDAAGAAAADTNGANLRSVNSDAYGNRFSSAAGPCVTPAQNAAYNDNYYNEPYYSSNRPVRVAPVAQPSYDPSYEPRQTYSVDRTHRRGRSTKRSLALVGGSAGVGAAIGALAGGGKAAGIGALSGGAAGFIYDRLTHKTHSWL